MFYSSNDADVAYNEAWSRFTSTVIEQEIIEGKTAFRLSTLVDKLNSFVADLDACQPSAFRLVAFELQISDDFLIFSM